MTAITLHNLVTELHTPNQSPTQILEQKISSAQWQATLYQMAGIICSVAFVAILGVVLATSYQLLVLTEVHSLILAGSALISPLFLLGPVKFSQLSTYYTNLANDESQTLLKLREIVHWDQAAVEDFFRREGLQIERLPLPALQQISPSAPHQGLLPLIARFQALKEKATTIQQAARRALREQEALWTAQEAQQGPINPLLKQKVRYENIRTHHDQLERIAIPAVLQAATLLQIIQNPTMADLSPESQEISGVGKWLPRPYPERVFAKLEPHYDDTYFQFLPALNRPPLTHAQIEQTALDPAALRRLLYPNG